MNALPSTLLTTLAVSSQLLAGCGSGDNPANGPDAGTLQVATKVTTSPIPPTSLAVDGEYVYWTADAKPGMGKKDSVFRAPKAGGPAELLYEIADGMIDALHPSGIVVDDAQVYWLASDDQRGLVTRIAAAGGEATVVAEGMRLRQFVVDEAAIFFDYQDPTSSEIWIGSVAKDSAGASPTPLALGPSASWGFAVDGDNIYGTDSLLQTIWKLAKTGGERVTVASSQDAVGIAADDASLFWPDRRREELRTVAKAGGDPTTLVDERGPFALDATHVYWAASGLVRKVPKSGGTPIRIAAGQTEPGGLVVDETHVYWLNVVDATVMVAVK